MALIKKFAGIAAAAMILSFSGAASAGVITCGSAEREASLGSAEDCNTAADVTGTPSAADVGIYVGGTWTNEGAVAGANGTNDLLTISNVTPSWGQGPLTGEWAINPIFWSTYSAAVITLHVGNGNGDPDWFFFTITPGATSGTFSYTSTSGGGLSNLFLWGSGASVPEPSTLALLGLGLAGIGFGARRRKA